MNTLGKSLIVILFSGFIISMGYFIITSKDNLQSYWENRSLAQKPELSTQSLIDGTYTSQFETYFTDQFPFRDKFVYSYIKYQQLANQTYIQNNYIDDTNFVYPKPLDVLPTNEIQFAARQTNNLASVVQNSNSNFIFFYMPNRVVVLHDNYPKFLKGETRVEAKDLLLTNLDDTFVKFDLNEYYQSSFTQQELKNLYYQTDHHWNANGALIGFQFILDKLKEVYPSLHYTNSEYAKENISSNLEFLGSYNRQIYNIINNHKDDSTFITSNTLDRDSLKIFNGPITTETVIPFDQIYQTEILNNVTPVTYAGIFAGDYREINFLYPKALNDKKVLIIKDSYTNAISSLLAEQFTQTTLYDVRHNQDRSLYNFIEEGQYDLVLFLNSDVSFTGNNFYFDGAQ